MSKHTLMAILVVILIINYVNSQYPQYSMPRGQQPVPPVQRGYRPTNYQMAGPDYGQQFGGQNGQKGQYGKQSGTMEQNGMSENAEYPTKGVLESTALFVSKKVRQTVTLIKCVLKCFMQRFTVNLCYQMFPCLYDCFIGQEFIPNDIEKQIEDIESQRGLVFPAAIDLKSIYTMIKCMYDCATERQIRDWETFAYSLYCFADACICYKIFNTNG